MADLPRFPRGCQVERDGIEYTVLSSTNVPWLPDYTGCPEQLFVYEHSGTDSTNPYWADAWDFTLSVSEHVPAPDPTKHPLLIPLIQLPYGPTNRYLPTGTPVAIVANRPVMPDDDPADEFTATGALIQYLTPHTHAGGQDEQVHSYYTHENIGFGNYSEYSTCLNLNTDLGMYTGISMLVRALGHKPVATGHDFYRVITGGYWLDLGEMNTQTAMVYFAPAATPENQVGWPTVVIPELADLNPADPDVDRLALVAILTSKSRIGNSYTVIPA